MCPECENIQSPFPDAEIWNKNQEGNSLCCYYKAANMFLMMVRNKFWHYSQLQAFSKSHNVFLNLNINGIELFKTWHKGLSGHFPACLHSHKDWKIVLFLMKLFFFFFSLVTPATGVLREKESCQYCFGEQKQWLFVETTGCLINRLTEDLI